MEGLASIKQSSIVSTILHKGGIPVFMDNPSVTHLVFVQGFFLIFYLGVKGSGFPLLTHPTIFRAISFKWNCVSNEALNVYACFRGTPTGRKKGRMKGQKGGVKKIGRPPEANMSAMDLPSDVLDAIAGAKGDNFNLRLDKAAKKMRLNRTQVCA